MFNNQAEIPHDDHNVWDFICDGKLVGCFQIESQLGTDWTRIIKPRNIDELADVISIIRPGVLNAKDDNGISMAQHYARRKNGTEPCDSLHPVIDPILNKTYNVWVYQEQIMKISTAVANFTGGETELLRKNIGKKSVKGLAELRQLFVDKSEEYGIISREFAETLFTNIQKSGRYLFCQAHAVSYAIQAYISAYAKYHNIKYFYKNWLQCSKEEQKPHFEAARLIKDAKYNFNIDVHLPNLFVKNKYFDVINDEIYFGLCNIKNIGEKKLEKLFASVPLAEQLFNKKFEQMSWMEILLLSGYEFSESSIETLIKAGALDSIIDNRREAVYQLHRMCDLTDKEREALIQYYVNDTSNHSLNLIELLEKYSKIKKEGGICSNVKRAAELVGTVNILKNPPYSLDQNLQYIADAEYETLGISLSCNRIDSKSVYISTTCGELEYKEPNRQYSVACEIDEVKEVQLKNGDNAGKSVAFIKIIDGDGNRFENVCCWSDAWMEYADILKPRATVILAGRLSIKNNKKSFSILSVQEI